MPKGKNKQKPGPAKEKPKVTVQQAVDNIVHSMRTRDAGRNRKILQWEELAQALGKGKGAARIAFLRNLNPNLRRGAFTAQEVMMVACLHLKMCRTGESPISDIGVALGTTDAYGLPLDFRSPFDISDLLRKTAEKDSPPRSAAYSLLFFHYARHLPALMARSDFKGERAADLLLWLVRSAVGSLGRGAAHDAELALLLRALCHTEQATKFGFRSNALPADMCK
ncbi:hypothetical protein COCOBI_09-0200 [Coccomyxa sp. Obi]|nr:hypothetical protein COCOBI_09-0200 [Coccomyxa sp. Obi]